MQLSVVFSLLAIGMVDGTEHNNYLELQKHSEQRVFRYSKVFESKLSSGLQSSNEVLHFFQQLKDTLEHLQKIEQHLATRYQYLSQEERNDDRIQKPKEVTQSFYRTLQDVLKDQEPVKAPLVASFSNDYSEFIDLWCDTPQSEIQEWSAQLLIQAGVWNLDLVHAAKRVMGKEKLFQEFLNQRSRLPFTLVKQFTSEVFTDQNHQELHQYVQWRSQMELPELLVLEDQLQRRSDSWSENPQQIRLILDQYQFDHRAAWRAELEHLENKTTQILSFLKLNNFYGTRTGDLTYHAAMQMPDHSLTENQRLAFDLYLSDWYFNHQTQCSSPEDCAILLNRFLRIHQSPRFALRPLLAAIGFFIENWGISSAIANRATIMNQVSFWDIHKSGPVRICTEHLGSLISFFDALKPLASKQFFQSLWSADLVRCNDLITRQQALISEVPQ